MPQPPHPFALEGKVCSAPTIGCYSKLLLVCASAHVEGALAPPVRQEMPLIPTQGLAAKLLAAHTVAQLNLAFCRRHIARCQLSPNWTQACAQVWLPAAACARTSLPFA